MRTVLFSIAIAALVGCQNSETEAPPAQAAAPEVTAAPKKPRPLDPKNIVSIAANSKDHSTLVKALEAADYVESIANPGPFTVFAPTNAAFDKLPKGTVEGLLAKGKEDDLRNVLKYHVAVSTYGVDKLHDGDVLAMANGAKATIHVKDGKVMINDATIVASIPASNGIVHVIDGVLLPPK